MNDFNTLCVSSHKERKKILAPAATNIGGCGLFTDQHAGEGSQCEAEEELSGQQVQNGKTPLHSIRVEGVPIHGIAHVYRYVEA